MEGHLVAPEMAEEEGAEGASESFGLSNPSYIHKPELINTFNTTG